MSLLRLGLLLISFFMASACERFSNDIGDLKLSCGSDVNLSPTVDVFKILDPTGAELKADDIEAFYLGLDSEGTLSEPLLISEKACVATPKNNNFSTFVVRSKDPTKSWAKIVEAGDHGKFLLSMELIDKQGLIGRCQASIYTSGRFQLPLADRGEGAGLSSLRASLIDSSVKIPLGEGYSLLDFDKQSSFQVPVTIADGRYQVSIEFRDLFRPSRRPPEDFVCELNVDRSPPEVKSSVIVGENSDELVKMRPGQLLSLRAVDGSPSLLYYCRQELGDSFCQQKEHFTVADTEVSFNVEDKGDWDLFYFAEDQASNRSLVNKVSYTVFNFDRLERIRLGSREAISLTKEIPIVGLIESMKLAPLYDDLSPREQLEAVYPLSDALYKGISASKQFRRIRLKPNQLEALKDDSIVVSVQGSVFIVNKEGKRTSQSSLIDGLETASIEVDKKKKALLIANLKNGSPGSRVELNFFNCEGRDCRLVKRMEESRVCSSTAKVVSEWSDDSRYILISRCGKTSLLDTSLEEPLEKPLVEFDFETDFVRFSPKNEIMFLRGPGQELYLWSIAERRLLNSDSTTEGKPVSANWLECNSTISDIVFKYSDDSLLALMVFDSGFSVWPIVDACPSTLQHKYVAWPEGRQKLADYRRIEDTEYVALRFADLLSVYSVDNLIKVFQDLQATLHALPAEEGVQPRLKDIPLMKVSGQWDFLQAWHFDSSEQKIVTFNGSELVSYQRIKYPPELSTAKPNELLTKVISQSKGTAKGIDLFYLKGSKTYVAVQAMPDAIDFFRSEGPLPEVKSNAAVAYYWGKDGQILIGDRQGAIFQMKSATDLSIAQEQRLPVSAVYKQVRRIEPFSDEKMIGVLEGGMFIFFNKNFESTSRAEIKTVGRNSEFFFEDFVKDPETGKIITLARNRIDLWSTDFQSTNLVKGIRQPRISLYKRLQLVKSQGRFLAAVLDSAVDRKPQDQKLLFFDFDGKKQEVAGFSEIEASAFALSPDGRIMVAIHDSVPTGITMTWIDLLTNSVILKSSTPDFSLTGQLKPLLWAEFSPDSRHLAVIGDLGRLAIYSSNESDFGVRKVDYKAPFPTQPLLSWIKPGDRLAFVESDNELVIADLNLNKLASTKFDSNIEMLSASPQGDVLAISTQRESSLIVFDLDFYRKIGCRFFEAEIRDQTQGPDLGAICP